MQYVQQVKMNSYLKSFRRGLFVYCVSGGLCIGWGTFCGCGKTWGLGMAGHVVIVCRGGEGV